MADKTGVNTTLSASAVDILNAIRNSASANYRDYVPSITGTEGIKEIGAIIMDYPALQNEFLNALVERIGRVIISSKQYTNPWSMFKKGTLEYGETVEEIFVELAKPFEYDPAVAESEVFKREIPDVRAAFHILNYQKFYKTTVQREQLRQAFLSADGITNLVTKIINALYTGAAYDEFQTMKYMVAKHIVNGELYPVQILTPDTVESSHSAVKAIKKLSNDFTFMSEDYNVAGVHTYTEKNDQYIIINSAFDATVDVDVLAQAFNMDKAEFSGHQVLVDGFGELDTDRLDELFAGNSWYESIDDDVLEALNAIPAVLVDREWFMIIDNMYTLRDQANEQGLYWNYFYHTWKTFSVSPFANAAVFVPGEPSVTSISITPSSSSAAAGQTVQCCATVTTENFASKAVVWTTDSDEATVDIYGKVTLSEDASGTITVTATSVYDSSVTATATITVS